MSYEQIERVIRKKSITSQEYERLDEDAKKDSVVIELLLKNSKKNIRYVPAQAACLHACNYPELLRYLTASQLKNGKCEYDLKTKIMSLKVEQLAELIGESTKETIIPFIAKFREDELYILCKRNRDLLSLLPSDISEKIKNQIKISQEKAEAAVGDFAKVLELFKNDKKSFAELCNKHPKYFLLMHHADLHGVNRISNYLDYYNIKTKESSEYLRYFNVNYNFSDEELLRVLPANFSLINNNLDRLKDSIYLKLDKIEDEEKRSKLENLTKSVKSRDKKVYLYRLLLDDRVVNNNDAELLKRYLDTLDRGLLIDILANAYGEHVREIMNERKYLNQKHLNTFAVFSPNMYDLFGKNFANYLMTFSEDADQKFMLFIQELDNDKSLAIQFYRYFGCMVKDDEQLDINTIHNILERFNDYRDVLATLPYEELSEEQIENIRLMINDPVIAGINVNNLEDINNYKEIRKDAFQTFVNSFDDSNVIKDAIFHFMMNTYHFDNSTHNVDRLSLEELFMIFDVDTIFNNKELIEKIGLTKEEVGVLLTLSEIKKIDDIQVLRDTFSAVLDKNLDFRSCRNIQKKIRTYFTNDVKSKLTNSKDLDRMEKIEKDGIEVVQLTGEPFRFIISHIGYDLNDHYVNGSFYGQLYGEHLLNNWLYREELSKNYISTSLVSSNTSISSIPDNIKIDMGDDISFIFDNDVDIVGMGTTDIATDSKRSQHLFRFFDTDSNNFEYATMERLEAAVNSQKDNGKFRNEIALARYKEDIRRSDSNERVMPIGMYVIGEISPKQLETAKAFDEYYKEHNLGRFKIIQVDPKVYLGKGRIEPDRSEIDKNENRRTTR